MEFGINTGARGILSTRDAYMTIGQLADRSGYDFLSVSDHVIVPRTIDSEYPYSEEGRWTTADAAGYCLEQLSTLCFLAGCTENLKLLTSVTVVPYRPAVLTAKILSTADVLSKGRIIFGVGAGWLREEFEALQTQPYEDRGRVTDEYIEACKELWSNAAPAYKGEHVDFEQILFAPKPYNGSSIPIWVGGESRPAMRRTVKLADAWYPGSRNPKFRFDTPERLAEGIGRIKAMAEKDGRDPASIKMAYVIFTPVDWTAQPGHDTPRRLMSGSTEQMADDVRALADIGVEYLNLTFPAGDLGELSEAMSRFAEEVMPLVKS